MKFNSAAEVIAFHFGRDVYDIKDGVYQPTRYASPRVYVYGDDYYCSPPKGSKKLPDPKHFKWTKIGEEYGREIYECKLELRP